MMGINVLIKETQDSLSPVLEHRISCLNTSKRALTRCRSSWDPDLRLPILQNYDKYIPVVKPPSRWYFVILAQTKTMI